MLVLSRRLNEEVTFPELGITVKVVDLGNGRVHLGIEAPRHIQISRPDARRPAPIPPGQNGPVRRKRVQLAG